MKHAVSEPPVVNAEYVTETKLLLDAVPTGKSVWFVLFIHLLKQPIILPEVLDKVPRVDVEVPNSKVLELASIFPDVMFSVPLTVTGFPRISLDVLLSVVKL